MSRGPDAATLVERALVAHARRSGIVAEILGATAKAWSSVTFNGARHILTMALRDELPTERWLAGLPDAELPIRGHLVADVAVVERARDGDGRLTATVEALTVEER